MRGSSCITILLLSSLCGVAKASKADSDVGYILGAIIIFMFFVFFCATGFPQFYRKCIKREVNMDYQPLSKSEASTYVPPSAPHSDALLPSSSYPPSSSSSSSSYRNNNINYNDNDKAPLIDINNNYDGEQPAPKRKPPPPPPRNTAVLV